MSAPLRVGVMGCGNISTTYFRLMPLFKHAEITACADLSMALAEQRAKEFGIVAMSPAQLLASPDIDIVLNLTIPAAHYKVSLAAVKAGKHVYSEKPLTLTLKDGLALAKLAKAKKVKVGCAPDTILGGSHQLARQAIDEGRIGKVTSGTAVIMSHGMEHWHPNPDFFFKPGGGPVLDMGPYYIGDLINLLGPVKRVASLTAIPSRKRTISSQPRAGETITVTTPTTIHGLLHFANGAIVTVLASWDVWNHSHAGLELYGSEGTMLVPDPNFFGGSVLASTRDGRMEDIAAWDHGLGATNEKDGAGVSVANYRGAGLADMAQAIRDKRDPRCSLERALHALEVMLALTTSGKTGKFIALKTSCTRPKPLPPAAARELLKD